MLSTFTLLFSTISIATAGLLNWQEFVGPYHQNDAQYKGFESILSKKQELQKRQEKYNVCRTKECFRIAAEFWESMNKSVDPCEDFYAYACGKWEIYNPIPPSEMQWNPLRKLQKEVANKIRDLLEERVQRNEALPVKQVKTFYQSCMNVDAIEKEGIKPLEAILVRNGGWPMIMEPGEWDPEIFSWKKVHDFYSHLNMMPALYKISVTKDLREINLTDEDEMKMTISIDPPMLPSVVLKPGEYFDRKRMYKDGSYAKFIKEVAMIFASERGAHINEDQIAKDVEDIIDMEKILGDYIYFFLTHNPSYTFDELQEYYDTKIHTPSASKINWRKTIEDLFAEANVEIEGDETIQVWPMFLSELANLLEDKTPRALVNYIHWHFLSNMLSYTNSKIQELEYEIKKEQAGVKEETPRWLTCVDNIKMEHAVSYMFVKKYFEEQMGIDAEKMFTSIKKEMAKHILKADWLDDSIRKMELEKLQKMRKNIGYPEWYNNITMLNNNYRGIPVGHNFFNNMLSYQRYSLKENLRTLKVKPREDEWYISPIVINALYIPNANSLTIPAADFQLPLYTIEKLQTINYGALGVIMGHEVSHGFDDTGSQYDHDGNKINLPFNIEKEYKKKMKCFVKQQKDFYDEYEESHASEENTVVSLDSYESFEDISPDLQKLGENIADSLGLDTVFGAFEDEEKEVRQPRLPGFEDLKNEQLFFLTFAKLWCENSTPKYDLMIQFFDEHSKSRYRVISSLQNSEGFAKAYNCPVGSKMNPARKCKLWK